ncbi:MAG TPA: bifunctional (p)ppGpp synthetase/guanosine-3',5'-bis(diphosphate) 3'-pyrophosphohydrolase [Candidatus Aphodovivens avistercoris]|nr:bifunctional (p)ppGpp synthetase/guanosine-3',5'-bis(diphosphate) 3'-pyrophosphohydrolase [Candidatus Aphodovivens avistercoris]
MIYTELTKRAMRLAYEAHAGQLDKCGDPYVFHPFHLAEQMPDETSVCVALLHDVVEDTAVTLDDLARAFPPQVVEGVRLLTHEEGTDYLDYVRAIKGHPIAERVKLADLAHNADESRYAGCLPSDAVLEKRRRKYAAARAVLLEGQG